MRLERRQDWDAWRGLLLVLITFNHVPNPWRKITMDPIGYVSNAEFFVFLSAFLAGRIFFKLFEDTGIKALREKVFSRVRTIYIYHLVSVAFVFFIAKVFWSDMHTVYSMLHYLLNHPWDAIVGALFLVYAPPMLDILPLYIVMVALTFPAFLMARRWGWWSVLAVSGAFWLAAQFGIKKAVLDLVGIMHPLDGGSFNLWAWQFLWMAGLAFGASSIQRDEAGEWRVKPFTIPMPLLWLAGVIVIAGVISQYKLFGISHLGGWPSFNKWHLGPLRLVNFFAFMAVFCAISRYLRPIERVQPLVVMGQHAIAAFTIHACLAPLAAVYYYYHRYGDAGQWLGLAIVLVPMWVAAYAMHFAKAKRRVSTRPRGRDHAESHQADPNKLETGKPEVSAEPIAS